MGNRATIQRAGNIRRTPLLRRIAALWKSILRGSTTSRVSDISASSGRLRGPYRASEVAANISAQSSHSFRWLVRRYA